MNLSMLLLMGLAGAGLTRGATRFDTGHHQDMTRNAMVREGFSSNAIQLAVIANWMPDFYGPLGLVDLATPCPPPTHDLACTEPTRSPVVAAAGLLHFDNLTTRERVATAWKALYDNYIRLLRTAESQGDPAMAVVLLGTTLHAVQDFYSHSNWAEVYPLSEGSYRSVPTWLDRGHMASADVRSGTFPGIGSRSHSAMHHDSYGRANWSSAYIYAYMATRQWIRLSQGVVQQTFWKRMLEYCFDSFITRAAVDRELEVATDLSLRAGHWKGPYSGSGRWSTLQGGFDFISDPRHLRFVRSYVDRNFYDPLTKDIEFGRLVWVRLPEAPPIRDRLLLVRTHAATQAIAEFQGDDVALRLRVDEALPTGTGKTVASLVEGPMDPAYGRAARKAAGLTGESQPWQSFWAVEPTSTFVDFSLQLSTTLGWITDMSQIAGLPRGTLDLELRFNPQTGQVASRTSAGWAALAGRRGTFATLDQNLVLKGKLDVELLSWTLCDRGCP